MPSDITESRMSTESDSHKSHWVDSAVPDSNKNKSSDVPAKVQLKEGAFLSSPARILSTSSRKLNLTPARVAVQSPRLKSKDPSYNESEVCKGNPRFTSCGSVAPARVHVKESVPSPSPMRVLSTPSRNVNQTPKRVPAETSCLKRKTGPFVCAKDCGGYQRFTPCSSTAPIRVCVKESVPSPSPMRILSTPSRKVNQTPTRVPVQSACVKRKRTVNVGAEDSEGNHTDNDTRCKDKT